MLFFFSGEFFSVLYLLKCHIIFKKIISKKGDFFINKKKLISENGDNLILNTYIEKPRHSVFIKMSVVIQRWEVLSNFTGG